MGRPSNAKVARYTFLTTLVEQIFDLLKWVVWLGGTALILFVAIVLPLRATVGKETSVQFIYRAIADFRLDFVLPTAAAGVAGLLWKRERKSHKDDIERFHKQIKGTFS